MAARWVLRASIEEQLIQLKSHMMNDGGGGDNNHSHESVAIFCGSVKLNSK